MYATLRIRYPHQHFENLPQTPPAGCTATSNASHRREPQHCSSSCLHRPVNTGWLRANGTQRGRWRRRRWALTAGFAQANPTARRESAPRATGRPAFPPPERTGPALGRADVVIIDATNLACLASRDAKRWRGGGGGDYGGGGAAAQQGGEAGLSLSACLRMWLEFVAVLVDARVTVAVFDAPKQARHDSPAANSGTSSSGGGGGAATTATPTPMAAGASIPRAGAPPGKVVSGEDGRYLSRRRRRTGAAAAAAADAATAPSPPFSALGEGQRRTGSGAAAAAATAPPPPPNASGGSQRLGGGSGKRRNASHLHNIAHRCCSAVVVARAGWEADDVIAVLCGALGGSGDNAGSLSIVIATADGDAQQLVRGDEDDEGGDSSGDGGGGNGGQGRQQEWAKEEQGRRQGRAKEGRGVGTTRWLQLHPLPPGCCPLGGQLVGQREVERRHEGLPPWALGDMLAMTGKAEASIGGVGLGARSARKLLAAHGSIEGVRAAAARGALKGFGPAVQQLFAPDDPAANPRLRKLLSNQRLLRLPSAPPGSAAGLAAAAPHPSLEPADLAAVMRLCWEEERLPPGRGGEKNRANASAMASADTPASASTPASAVALDGSAVGTACRPASTAVPSGGASGGGGGGAVWQHPGHRGRAMLNSAMVAVAATALRRAGMAHEVRHVARGNGEGLPVDIAVAVAEGTEDGIISTISTASASSDGISIISTSGVGGGGGTGAVLGATDTQQQQQRQRQQQQQHDVGGSRSNAGLEPLTLPGAAAPVGIMLCSAADLAPGAARRPATAPAASEQAAAAAFAVQGRDRQQQQAGLAPHAAPLLLRSLGTQQLSPFLHSTVSQLRRAGWRVLCFGPDQVGAMGSLASGELREALRASIDFVS